MTMSFPAAKKTRRPLAELPNVPVIATSAMSQGSQDTGVKRPAKDYDGAAPGGSSSQPVEKKRRASKRVSFGGEHVKLFDSNVSINYDDFNDKAEVLTGGAHFADPSNRSPHTRGINRQSGINSFDDVGEDTLTLLPKNPRPSFANSSAPLTAKNIVNMGPSHSSRFSLDPRKYDGFVDEDIERGHVPRFSIPGDETLTLQGRSCLDIDQTQPQETTMSSEEDVTLQLTDFEALEDEAQPAHYELSARASNAQTGLHSFDREYDGVDDYFADDVKSPFSKDVKSPFSKDLQSNPTASHEPPAVTNSGSKPFHKQHVRQATQSLPRTHPSPAKRMPRQSLPENRRLFSNDNEDEDTTIHFHDTQVQPPKRPQQPTSILKKTNYPQPLSMAQANSVDSHDLQSPGDHSLNRPDNIFASTPQSGRKMMSTPQSVLGSKLRAVALQGSASKRHEDASISIDHSISLGAHDHPSMHDKSKRKLTIHSFLDAAGIHFKDCYALARSMSSPNASLSRGMQLASSEDRNTLSGQIVSCVTHEAVLNELQNARATLTELAATIREHVQNISEDIEQSPPSIFAKVLKSSGTSPEQISVIQTGLKRLRRIATMRSSLVWVTSRQARERRIAELLKNSLQSLERDTQRMINDEAESMSHRDYLSSHMGNLNLSSMSMKSAEICTPGKRDKLVAVWKSFKQEWPKLQGYKDRRKELMKKAEELKKKKATQALKLAEARKHLSTGSASMLEGILEKKKTLQHLHSFISGILPLKICGAHMDVRVGSYADVRFSLRGDSVQAVEVQPLEPFGLDLPSVVPAFIKDAILKCAHSCLNNVSTLSQVPLVLHLAREYLTNVKQSCRDVLQYLDEHEQGSEFFERCSPNADSADLGVIPCYFSVQKRCKFDVTFIGRHFPPKFDGTSLAFQPAVYAVSVTSVCPIIGKAPSEKDVEDALQFRNNEEKDCASKLLGMRQNMEAIWVVLLGSG